jgi:hypothetical protein
MLKPISAVMAAAIIAAAVTALTAPSGKVTAGPLEKAASHAMRACAQRPWPYLNCVGTPFGNPHVRLVTADQSRH